MATQTWVNLATNPKVAYSTGWVGRSYNTATSSSSPSVPLTPVASAGPAGISNYGSLPSSGIASWDAAIFNYNGHLDASPIDVQPGETVTLSMWMRCEHDANRMTLSAQGYRYNGFAWVPVGWGSVPVVEIGAVAANTWALVSSTFVVPQQWERALVAGVIYCTSAHASFNSLATGLSIVPAQDSVPYNGPYFDGSTTDVPGVAEYAWLGATDNSISTLTLTVPDPEPQPAQSSAQVIPVPNPVIPRVLKPLYLKDFSVQEDSTPIYASDMTGGAGTMDLQVDENGDTPYLLDAEIDLVDPAQGTTRGTIRNLAADNTQVSISADSRMALLNVTRNAAAFSGTLEDALTYYFDLCGITDGFVIEDSIQSIPVKFLGFSGNVLEELKKLGVANGVEFSLISNNIVARPIRQNVSQNYRDSSRSWSYDTSQKAQSVEIYKYTVSEVTNGLIYNGYTENQTPLVVDAGTTAEFTIPFNGSLISIDQPVFTTTIGPGDPGFSAYNVSGNDNLPITQAQWEGQGGRLSVSISDDTRSIIVSITAPTETQYSPYRIGVSDGEETYSTLRLHGSALLYEKELHTYHTAVDPDRVSREVGATVDSPYIQTDQQLLDAAMGELRYWGGNRRTINVATRGINRLGDNGSYAYAEFSDFDAWWDNASPGATFGDFDADAPATFGNTFGEHDEWWIEEVQDDFANQAFGNIAGARVFTDSNVHRIRTATTTPEGITYTAWEDSIFSDHDALWDAAVPGATFADFDAHWLGRAFVEFDATPLEPVD